MLSRGNPAGLLANNASDGTSKNELRRGAQIPVTVYVRHGILLSMDPRNPNREIACTVGDKLKAKFEGWKANCRSIIPHTENWVRNHGQI